MFISRTTKIVATAIYFFFLPFNVLAEANSTSESNFNFKIQGKPCAPYPSLPNYNRRLTDSGVGPNYPIEMRRHHIIPYLTLHNFYDTVISHNHISYLAGFARVFSKNIARYAAFSNRPSCINHRNDVEEAENFSNAVANDDVRPGGDAYHPGFDLSIGFYIWFPGNLFIGPANRSDDPGSQLDQGGIEVVRQAGNHLYTVYQRLYDNMNAYIRAPHHRSLKKISVDLIRLLARQEIYPFNADQWELSHGKYKVKRHGRHHHHHKKDEL